MSATATIRARREALKLTQKTAAQLAGVTEPTWQRFETGGKIAPYLASRCMRLLNGEVKIPRGTPRKRSPAECAAMAKNPHRYTRAEARKAGKKGGEAVAAVPNHMANLGRKGGRETQRRRRERA
jgi:DNA-binding XRE family transcriptional regulator/general stress protein YciG